MKYTVTHATKYRYSSPVSVCHNVLMLEPRQSSALTCDRYEVKIIPEPKIIGRREDMFGNRVTRFSLEENHSQLTITSSSHVRASKIELPPLESSPSCSQIAKEVKEQSDPNWLSVSPFVFDSPRIKRTTQFAEYAADCLTDETPILEAAMNLTRKIYADFEYDTDATLVDTPTSEAFRGRNGVCQDFAHVAVACLRSCGLPARYVSGYLRTIPSAGTERLVGADESHAWFAVYCGNNLGWVDFDPTNNCLCNTDHVPITFGRDYSDVVPVKGIFLGGGKTSMVISVDVAPVV